VTMLDALPYLIDYPYGCTEQTMSRFLPAAIVARTLTKNGLDPAAIEGRLFGGVEPGSAGATHPKGRKDLRSVASVTASSMARLYDFQHEDGGWGWWKEGNSDRFMTAYVVWGFSVAKEGGLTVDAAAVNKAVTFLDDELVKMDGDTHSEAWVLHAIAAWKAAVHDPSRGIAETKAFDDVWSHRESLTPYSRPSSRSPPTTSATRSGRRC
jgi:alpha-2-macroglobulin